MPEVWRFPILIVASLIVFVAILRFAVRKRPIRPSAFSVFLVSAIVVVGGMTFAKATQNAGWPWWIYYTVPALVTLLLPPVAFRFSGAELWRFLLLALQSGPLVIKPPIEARVDRELPSGVASLSLGELAQLQIQGRVIAEPHVGDRLVEQPGEAGRAYGETP